jgi:hypothetical protein
MRTTHKHLVTDESGQPVSVLIPYQEWLEIERQLTGVTATRGAAQLQCHAGAILCPKSQRPISVAYAMNGRKIGPFRP